MVTHVFYHESARSKSGFNMHFVFEAGIWRVQMVHSRPALVNLPYIRISRAAARHSFYEPCSALKGSVPTAQGDNVTALSAVRICSVCSLVGSARRRLLAGNLGRSRSKKGLNAVWGMHNLRMLARISSVISSQVLSSTTLL